MALYAALRAPAYLGRALSQSGSFGLPGRSFESVIYEMARHSEARPAIWMDVGRYEALLESNRRMHGVLTERGHDVTYRETHGGHNYVSWRNDIWRGLESLYGEE
jgi:enterochelin esterase family protein